LIPDRGLARNAGISTRSDPLGPVGTRTALLHQNGTDHQHCRFEGIEFEGTEGATGDFGGTLLSDVALRTVHT